VPGDHDLYLAGFADDNHECLRLLLFHAADVAQLARMALAAPISLNDAEGVHLLLEAGADPNRYADDADPLSPVIYAANRSGCSAELTGLLLGYGADPHIPGPDGRSPYVLAVTQGRTGLAMLLRQHGADVCWPPARTRTGPRSSGCWPPTPGCPVASPPRSRPWR
jgi:ankyrin repeat protein